MNKHNYVYVVSYIFLLIGVVHALRLLYGWEVEVGNNDIPMWVSWVGTLVPLYLSYWGFRFAKHM